MLSTSKEIYQYIALKMTQQFSRIPLTGPFVGGQCAKVPVAKGAAPEVG